jgi:HlyD family secretion protein
LEHKKSAANGSKTKKLWLFARRHPYLSGISLLLVLSLVAYIWWSGRPIPPRYITAPVTRGPVVKEIITTGAVNPVVTVQVGSYVSGIIKALYCDYNTVVKAGQLCAKIDPRPYQLTVEQRTADLASARAQLEKDRANLAYARTNYERDLSLLKEGVVSQETVDTDKSAYHQARAQITLDKATIKQREAALNAAKVNLGFTDIVSPVNGVVVSRNIDVGQTVAASFQTPTLFLIAKDLTKMQVDTNVSESDVGEAKVGQKASFTVEAYPNKPFWGKVTQIRQAPITVQNVVTYDVVVSVSNPKLELLPGMTANTRIVADERKNVMRVPIQAIRFDPGGLQKAGKSAESNRDRKKTKGSQVWVLRDGKPYAIPVTTGLRDTTYVEITGGKLQVGDAVIVNVITGANGNGSNRRRHLRF